MYIVASCAIYMQAGRIAMSAGTSLECSDRGNEIQPRGTSYEKIIQRTRFQSKVCF